MKQRIVLGTRGSPLAFAQAEEVKRLLQQGPLELDVWIQTIQTEGDENAPRRERPRTAAGKRLFTGRIEEALERGEIDLAVHSLKDLPADSSPQLVVGAVPRRRDPRDAWVSRRGEAFSDLKPHAVVATSSLRRIAQLKRLRPDLRIAEAHGNVGTRLRKLDQGEWDALVLAVAGLERLGEGNRIVEALSPDRMLPAPGQGALGVQIRKADTALKELLASINHSPSQREVEAERTLSRELGGDCNVPLGALAQEGEGILRLEACVLERNGARVVRAVHKGAPHEAASLGKAVAMDLLKQGANEILAEGLS